MAYRSGFALIVLLLAGCATQYQPLGEEGGYAETELGNDTFEVAFIGNSQTGTEMVEEFALLRAAELCLERGYKFLVIKSDETNWARRMTNMTVIGPTDDKGTLGARRFEWDRKQEPYRIITVRFSDDSALLENPIDAAATIVELKRRYGLEP